MQVCGPVVWIPGIPANERDCYLRVPLESQTTGPQTTHLPLVELSQPAQNYGLARQFPPNVPHSGLGRIAIVPDFLLETQPLHIQKLAAGGPQNDAFEKVAPFKYGGF